MTQTKTQLTPSQVIKNLDEWAVLYVLRFGRDPISLRLCSTIMPREHRKAVKAWASARGIQIQWWHQHQLGLKWRRRG